MAAAPRPARLAALVAGLAALLPADAQQHAFRQLTTRDGLAQSQVRAMAQDGQGHLWFGTLGGASRYDGHSFLNHALQEGLPDAHVSALAVDASGTLWMGSGSSLVRVRGRHLLREQLPVGKGGGTRILALVAGRGGELFAGTDGDGLFMRDAQGLRPMVGYPLDTAGHVRSLLALSDGRLLVGLRNGLLLWDGARFSSVRVGDEEPKAISALGEAPDGSWWVGTFMDGLFHIRPDGRWRNYDEDSGLLRDNVRCLLIDGERLWVGTKAGLNLLEGGRMRVFTTHQGMPNDNVWCALKDSEGNLWFGTDGAGALMYAGDRFTTYTVKDGLCSDLVMGLTADAQGALWLCTYDNGACRLDGMGTYGTREGLPNNTVWCGLSDRQGTLWLGTSDGLARIAQGVVKPLSMEASLAGQRVFALHEDAKGRIWCGTREGLSMIAPDGGVRHYPSGANGPGRSVRAIARDRKDRLWLATDHGISLLDNDSFTTLAMADGLCDNTVHCLVHDGAGRLWAGTANGLSCHDGERFRTFRFAPDFGSNNIGLLTVDGRGRIWAGTNNGLYLFHPDSLLLNPSAHSHIAGADGLLNLEFNLNAGFRDARGRMFFGSAGGLVLHDVERHPSKPRAVPPRTHINGVRSFLQATDWSGQCDSLDASGLPVGLWLPYRRNHITFDYAGISLAEPGRVRYRYRLLGLDDDWLPHTDARFASYSGLAQGDYAFEVAAATQGGEWGAPVAFRFGIEPPFWLRWWFFALCVVGLAGSAYGALRYRALRRQRRERTRQLVLRSRMLQLEQQALNANMNRHFVFNALNSIQYHINRQDRATASRYLSSFAKLIRRNLDASQNDTTTLAEELERLELYLQLEHMRFKDKFRYRIEVMPGVDTGGVRLPAMMLQPYVENSIWHGILPMGQQGEVAILVEPASAGRVRVRIEDDGIGVERSRASKQGMDGDHISRGIEITKGRADVLRRLDITDIRITGPKQWHDPATGKVHGTRVAIELPAGEGPKKSAQGLVSGQEADYL